MTSTGIPNKFNILKRATRDASSANHYPRAEFDLNDIVYRIFKSAEYTYDALFYDFVSATFGRVEGRLDTLSAKSCTHTMIRLAPALSAVWHACVAFRVLFVGENEVAVCIW